MKYHIRKQYSARTFNAACGTDAYAEQLMSRVVFRLMPCALLCKKCIAFHNRSRSAYEPTVR